MAYIDLGNDLPGIRGLMAYRPDIAGPMNQLAELLLRSPHPGLSPGERELIGAYVSARNDCFFCREVHSALAGHYLQCDAQVMDGILANAEGSDLSPKMKALLHLAGLVQQSGSAVTEKDVAAARAAGASDRDLHDTVLIAAAFSMFNRYVDGLGTEAPRDRSLYLERAPRRAAEGYLDFDPYKR